MNQRWQIGDVEVTCVVETAFDVPAEVIVKDFSAVDLGDSLAVLQPSYITDSLLLRLSIQSFAIRVGDRRIIVDTCFGNDHDLPGIGMLHTAHLEALAGAGFERQTVDTVVCTHLHTDHVGWNTMLVDGEWVATFPNAEYLFGATEHAHWSKHEQAYAGLDECIDPIIAAGLHRFVETDHEITPEIRLVPTPGHTPGHVSVRIDSGGRSAVITGDMVHHPAQIFRHDWPSVPDHDPITAVASRRAMFSSLVDSGVLVLGTHFAEPASGYITRREGGWGWTPQP
jgi:glyoxylase-like metal-dependent hydrolase (beta-lactamase superfamily II)